MDRTYLFETDKGRFIINDERSGIGYSYPRIFVENLRCNKYYNFDVTLGNCFYMKRGKADFESWLDGTQIVNANIEKLCEELNLKYKNVMELVGQLQSCEE